jgi:hypothetical protein
METLEWLWNIALLAGAKLVPLSRSANERGINALGLALGPPAKRLGLAAVWSGLQARDFEALYLAGPLPDLGGLKPPFLICQDTHWSPNAARADVVLPAAAFAESGGTWVNTEGRVRTCAPAVPAPGAARPDGVLLAGLAARMGHSEWARTDRAAVLGEICGRVAALEGYSPDAARGSFFLSEPAAPGGGFVPVAAPLPRRGPRPSPKPGEAPVRPPATLRGFDLAAENRGYARLRRAR